MKNSIKNKAIILGALLVSLGILIFTDYTSMIRNTVLHTWVPIILILIVLGALAYYIITSNKKITPIIISAASIFAGIVTVFVTVPPYIRKYMFKGILRPQLYPSLSATGEGIFVATLIAFVALLISLIRQMNQEALQKQQKRQEALQKSQGTYSVDSESAYCSLTKHVLLLLFTFGIWLFIWIYRMTKYTNAVEDEEPRNPTNKLLLCLFVPFYLIYWTYKTAQRVDKMASAKGISSDISTLCLILAIFVPIIPPILLQDVMNKIAMASDTQPISNQKEDTAKEIRTDTADEIKKFKELLDSGAITQEEFDAKKKQLLGL